MLHSIAMFVWQLAKAEMLSQLVLMRQLTLQLLQWPKLTNWTSNCWNLHYCRRPHYWLRAISIYFRIWNNGEKKFLSDNEVIDDVKCTSVILWRAVLLSPREMDEPIFDSFFLSKKLKLFNDLSTIMRYYCLSDTYQSTHAHINRTTRN